MSSSIHCSMNDGLVLTGGARKKHVLQTLETCPSRPIETEVRSNCTSKQSNLSLTLNTSAPTQRDGGQPPSEAKLCLEPIRRSSVLSMFSFSRIADIQRLISVISPLVCGPRSADATLHHRLILLTDVHAYLHSYIQSCLKALPIPVTR